MTPTARRCAALMSACLAGALTLAACSDTSTTGPDARRSSSSASARASSSMPSSPTAHPARDEADAGLPTQAELDAARRDVAKLTTKQLAGQVIVGYYRGTSAQDAAAAVRKDGLGGVIMMGDNVPTGGAAGTTAVASAVQHEMAASGRGWPAVVGTDQEGGPVARFGAPVTPLPAGMAYGAANDTALATRVSKGSGQELRALGINMVFAPDADVTVGPSDPTIGVRSPGSDPHRVARIVNAQVKGFQESGVVPVIKHFPGHGSVTTDTHVSYAVQHQPVSALMKRDWVPFSSAVKAGVPAVMTAHIVLKDVDPNVPSTLSEKVLTGQLRDKLGFKGLIVTDGMNMGAIVNTFDKGGAAAVSALKAGADVVLMPVDATKSVAAIVAAVERGELSRDRLVESAARIVATMRHHEVKAPPVSVIGSHDADAATLARDAITQVGGTCGTSLVGRSVHVQGSGSPHAMPGLISALEADLRKRGVSVGASGTTINLIGAGGYNAGASSADGGAEAKKKGGSGAGATSASGIQVALDTPYVLAKRPKGSVGLATYGQTPETLSALADVLTGKAKAGGTLPVAVGSTPIGSSACH